MKIFLSSLECGTMKGSGRPIAHYFVEKGLKMKWNLMSYYYIQKQRELADYIKKNSELILIDSGAHSFQKGKKVDWINYTKEYAKFIQEFDEPKVLGYFEMDVDNIIGYEKVLELRKILETVSNKIIPVWHKNRGVDDFKKMCQQYSGKLVAITGFRNEDIKDEQYLMFLKYAKKYNCKVHCLGMTRKKVLDKVPFDFTDSSSWKQEALYGRVGNKKVSRAYSKTNWHDVMLATYKEGMKMQQEYYKKWGKLKKN